MISPDRFLSLIDKLITSISNNKRSPSAKSGYEYPALIEQKGDADDLVIFFAHHNASREFIEKTIKQFQGSNVIAFVGGDPLDPNPHSTIIYYHESIKYMLDKIEKHINIFKPKSIVIVGVSLGSIFALPIAEKISQQINKLILVVSGASLAKSLWRGIQTQDLKRAYAQQGFTDNTLDELWKTLSPESHLDLSGVRSISIFLKKVDKVVPYDEGKRLAELIKEKFPDKTSVNENKYKGHALTILWSSKNLYNK